MSKNLMQWGDAHSLALGSRKVTIQFSRKEDDTITFIRIALYKKAEEIYAWSSTKIDLKKYFRLLYAHLGIMRGITVWIVLGFVIFHIYWYKLFNKKTKNKFHSA